MKDTDKGNRNEGIIGNVTASVVAVGTGATAIQNNSSIDKNGLVQGLTELRRAIESLSLRPEAQEALTNDLAALETESNANSPKVDRIGGILQGLAGKLKMVGVVLTESIALAEPVRKIADAFHVTVQYLGLG